jgi:hypothetical protein
LTQRGIAGTYSIEENAVGAKYLVNERGTDGVPGSLEVQILGENICIAVQMKCRWAFRFVVDTARA